MVGLVDIAPLSDTVTLRGTPVELRGVPLVVITDIVVHSEELRMVLAQRALSEDLVMSLVQQVPVAVAQFIAAGVGKPGDDATIDFALRNLVAGESAEIVQKLITLTFPQGLKSFMAGLSALAPESVQRGWDQGMSSPMPSPSAFGLDIESATSGNTPPESSSLSPN